VRSSSTEHPSGGNQDLGGSGGIEREPHSRGAEAFPSPNVQMDVVTSKQRRDKTANKGQQDEEEERGRKSSLKKKTDQNNVFLFLEIIRVYDGNATYRNGTPRSISVLKQATYTQILVHRCHFIETKNDFSFFQEAALRTFHINDDSTKYCLTVPTDDGRKTKQPIEKTINICFLF
jgi:hypothetical protein